MTTTNDRVLAAIADGETTVQGICETTGLEANQVHQAAFLLKKSGSIIKGEAGYELTDAALEPPAAEDSSPPPSSEAQVQEAHAKVSARTEGSLDEKTQVRSQGAGTAAEQRSRRIERPRVRRVRSLRRLRRLETTRRRRAATAHATLV